MIMGGDANVVRQSLFVLVMGEGYSISKLAGYLDRISINLNAQQAQYPFSEFPPSGF